MAHRNPTRRHRDSDEYREFTPLFARLRDLEPDDPLREELRERLITGHLPLAEHIAQRFSGKGIAKDDLLQVASVGLIHAIDRFDPHYGTDFLCYAVPTVMGEVRRYFRDTSWPMRVPRRLQELRLSINQAMGELAQRLGRDASPAELAAYLDVTPDELAEGMEVRQVYRSLPLDEPMYDDVERATLAECVGAVDEGLGLVEDHETLVPLLESLPEREQRIIGLRFFENKTQTQIAAEVGISQMHVSRLLSRTLGELRAGMLDATP